MSTGYGREGIRQVCATLLMRAMYLSASAAAASVLLEALYQVFDLYLYLTFTSLDRGVLYQR